MTERMPSFFNGTGARKIFFNGVELSQAYMNGQLVFQSQDYYLNLSGVSADKVAIPQTEKVYQVGQTGDFEFGIKIRVPSSNPSQTAGLIGYNSLGGAQRWGLFIRNTGIISMLFYNTSVLDASNIISNFGGQIVDIKAGWYGNEVRIYINDVIVGSTTYTLRPNDVTVENALEMTIGAFQSLQGRLFTGEVYNWFIDDDIFPANEGSGFDVVSDLGTIATGQTANTGGLTYWNNNVWQPQ